MYSKGFLLFDSHSRNELGEVDGDGVASVYRFDGVDDVAKYLFKMYETKQIDFSYFWANQIISGDTITLNGENRKEWPLLFNCDSTEVQWTDV